jgi:hypothetical protein
MNEDDLNSLLFLTLNEIRKLGSPTVSMWGINDRYSTPPYLRFRFKDTPADDPIYKKLGDVIARFKGNLKWEMLYEPSKSVSFFILSHPFAHYILKDNFHYERKSFLAFMSRTDYENTIDKTIMDIPQLAEYITEQFKEADRIELNELFTTGRFSEHIRVGLTQEEIETTLGLRLGSPDIETPDVNLYFIEIKPGLVVSISFDKNNVCYEIDLAIDESPKTHFYLRFGDITEDIHQDIQFEHLLSLISSLNIKWHFDSQRTYLQTFCIFLDNGLRLYYSFGNKKDNDFGFFSIKSILENHRYTTLVT